jgi:hypothetical protein
MDSLYQFYNLYRLARMPRSSSTSRKYLKRKLVSLPNTELTLPNTELTQPNTELAISTPANIPQSDYTQSKFSSSPTTSTKKQEKTQKEIEI